MAYVSGTSWDMKVTMKYTETSMCKYAVLPCQYRAIALCSQPIFPPHFLQWPAAAGECNKDFHRALHVAVFSWMFAHV